MKKSNAAICTIAFLLIGCSGTETASTVQPPSTINAAPVQGSVDFPANRANYSVVRNGDGVTVTDVFGGAGKVYVGSAAPLRFLDMDMSFDVTGIPGSAYRLYQAAFNRKPDSAGLGYWINALNNGFSGPDVAAAFIASKEFQATYGSNPSNLAMVTQFYKNVLHREPDQAGLDYWVNVLDKRLGTPAGVLWSFSQSPENKSLVDVSLQSGIGFTPYPKREFSVDDNFSGTALNTCRWFDWSNEAPRAQQQQGLILLTSPDKSVSQPQVESQYNISGDFSVQVDVSVDENFEKTIPSNAQKTAGIGLHVDTNNYFTLRLAREGGKTVVKPLERRAGTLNNLPVMAIEGRNAKLRVRSNGGILDFSFDQGNGWRPAGTTQQLSDGSYRLSLGASTIGVAQEFKATFQQFAFNGSSSYRPYARGPAFSRSNFQIGGVLEGYAYDNLFNNQWGNVDLFAEMMANGMTWVRTTVTTQSIARLRNTPVQNWPSLTLDGTEWQSQELTGEVMRRAGVHGMNNILAFFFSDVAANASAQKAPAAWRGLSVEATAAKVEEHTRTVAAYYKSLGIPIPIYEIGNETDFGILEFRPGERLPMPASGDVVNDFDYLRSTVWSTEAILFKAAIRGIRAVNPDAKIVIHSAMFTLTPADALVKAFFKSMVDNGVDFDIAGLSLPYPDERWRVPEYTTDCLFQRQQETTDYLAALGKKVMVSEGAYPNTVVGNPGTPMKEFAFSDAGQAAWVRENLRFAVNNPHMSGFMYFYPEWYKGRAGGAAATLMLDSYGLFNPDKSAKPALKEFKLPLSSP